MKRAKYEQALDYTAMQVREGLTKDDVSHVLERFFASLSRTSAYDSQMVLLQAMENACRVERVIK